MVAAEEFGVRRTPFTSEVHPDATIGIGRLSTEPPKCIWIGPHDAFVQNGNPAARASSTRSMRTQASSHPLDTLGLCSPCTSDASHGTQFNRSGGGGECSAMLAFGNKSNAQFTGVSKATTAPCQQQHATTTRESSPQAAWMATCIGPLHATADQC